MINSIEIGQGDDKHDDATRHCKDFELLNQATAAGLVDKAAVERTGLTLDQFVAVANAVASSSQLSQVEISLYRAVESEQEKYKLKELIVNTLRDQPTARIACNYHMSTAGQEPYGGHFSPVIAYHESSDSFLIMDVWPDTQPFWICWELLWKACAHPDTSTGLQRGFSVIDWCRNINGNDS
jgi:hypothetical protein